MSAGNSINATLIGLTTVTVRSVEGIDQPGRGSDVRPYKTIAYALANTTLSSNTLYLFNCFGDFVETFPALSPNLIFSGNGGSLKINNAVSLAGSWSGVSGTLMFNGFSKFLDFVGGVSLNFSSSPSSMLKIQNCFITKEVAGWTITGNSSNENKSAIYIDYLPGMSPSITQTDMIILNSNNLFSANAPLSITGTALSISQSSASTNGYLSSADWSTFNSKQPAGAYITALTGDVTATGAGSSIATIAASAVTNPKMANMPPMTFKANNTGLAAAPLDITIAQAQAILGISGGITIGLNQIGYGNNSNNINGNNNFTFDPITGSMNIGGGTLSSTALIQMTSTTKLLELMRMTSAQRLSITPSSGCGLCFDTDLQGVCLWNGTDWSVLG